MSIFFHRGSLWPQDFFISPEFSDFQINLNLKYFSPEEISIKLCDDNFLIIEAKHVEKQNKEGSVFRHFIEKVAIPKGCELGKIQSKLYPDGTLLINIPKPVENSRNIPIKRVQNKTQFVKAKL